MRIVLPASFDTDTDTEIIHSTNHPLSKNYGYNGWVYHVFLPKVLFLVILLCPFRAVRVFNYPGISPVTGLFTQDIALDCVLHIWGGCIKA